MKNRNCNLPMNCNRASERGVGASRPSASPAVALQFKTGHTSRVREFQFGGEFVWRPTRELIAQSNLQRFINKHALGSYDELMRRSTTDIAWFWDTVLRDLEIEFYKPYSRVVDLSEGKPWARWCVDGEMNIVHNMLDKYAGTSTDERIAIKSEVEDETTRTLTYKELRQEVNKMATALRSLSLGRGDAVAAFLRVWRGRYRFSIERRRRKSSFHRRRNLSPGKILRDETGRR